MKTAAAGLLCAAIFLFSCSMPGRCAEEQAKPEEPASGGLFQIVRQGRWGYMDRTGKVVVAPKFANTGEFSEGLGAVQVGDKWGYVDGTGSMVIKPQFDECGNFSEGLAAVQVGGQWGYVDRTGNMAVRAQFNLPAAPFSEGLAAVGHYEEAGGRPTSFAVWYIDKTGKRAFPASFTGIRNFSEGLAAVVVIKGVGEAMEVKVGYIDKTGKLVIPLREFEDVSGFREGLAMVMVGDKWGAIDKTGKMVIEPQFDGADVFCEGLAAIQKGGREKGKWGYADKTGGIVIQPQFDLAGGFSEGLAPVKVGDKWGYVDKSGKIVIKPRFDDCGRFSAGCAPVRVGDKSGYIDPSGGYILPPQK